MAVVYAQFSDEDLLSLVKVQDKLAYTELYSRHWQFLYIHAYRITGEEDLSKDLVQDVFYVFWEKAGELKINQNVKGYLFVSGRSFGADFF